LKSSLNGREKGMFGKEKFYNTSIFPVFGVALDDLSLF
jgi:hypothetical protein